MGGKLSSIKIYLFCGLVAFTDMARSKLLDCLSVLLVDILISFKG